MSSVNFADSQPSSSHLLYDNDSPAAPPPPNRANTRRRARKTNSIHCSNDPATPTTSDGPSSKPPSPLATPPTPSSQCPSTTKPSLDPVVAFSGRTAVGNPLPTTNPITLDSTVALNGRTDDDRFPLISDSSPIRKSQYPLPKRMSRKKRNSKKRKNKPYSPSPVPSPVASTSNISVVDLSPSDENPPPSTSHLQPTMEDITDVEDPIPSSSSFSSRPSPPRNRETDRVTPSSQDPIIEPNDTFQTPPPLSPHRFISQPVTDANDPVSNPPSPAPEVLNADPPSSMDNNDSKPAPPPPDSHDNRSAPSQSVDSDTEARVSFTGVTVVDPSVPAKTPEEIPFHPNPDAENVTDFVSIWSSKTSSASDFGEFSNVCEALAPAVVEKGKGMSNNTSGRRRIPRPAPHRPNRRSPHPHRT